jgi:hypothetical protein
MMTPTCIAHSAPQAGFGWFRKNAPRKERNLVPPKTDCTVKRHEKYGHYKTRQGHRMRHARRAGAQQHRFEMCGVRAKFFLAFPIDGKQRVTFFAN